MNSGSPARLSRSRQVAFTLITAAVPIVAGALLIEGGLRWWVHAPTDRASLRQALDESASLEVHTTDNLKGLVRPAADPDLIYELKPAHRWIFRGAPTHTNRQGYRGPNWPDVKAAGTWRVAGLGDSVSFGWGVADEATYLARLGVALGPRVKRPVEVLNFGVPGYNTRQEAALLRLQVLPAQPDVVVLMYCLNDWAAPFFLPHEAGGIVESSVALRYVKRLAYPMGNDVVHAALADIARDTQAAGVPVVFCVFPQATDAGTLARLRGLATRFGWRYVDLYAAYATYLRSQRRGPEDFRELYVRPDDPHPTTVGHQLIADALLPAIVEVLQTRAAH